MTIQSNLAASHAKVNAAIASFEADFKPIRAKMSESDVKGFHAQFDECCEAMHSHFNFEHYRRSLQAMKAKHGGLSPKTEATYLERFRGNIENYSHMVDTTSHLVAGMGKVGLDKLIEKHAQSLLSQFPISPLAPKLSDKFRTMGASEIDIAHYTAWLKANNWDVLHVHGANGTMAGLVKVAREQIPGFEKMYAVEKQHGLPVVDGACNSAGEAVFVGTIVVIATVCLFC